MALRLERHADGFWYVKGTVTIRKNGRFIFKRVNRPTRFKDRRWADVVRRRIEIAIVEEVWGGPEQYL